MARKNETKTDLGVLTEDLGMQINAFPKLISLDYSNPPRLVMKLEKEAAGFLKKGKRYINMQENSACFEAWCLIIKAQTKTNNPDLEIELDVKDITDARYPGGKPANGHLGRFLYRILKFSEQYKWFRLSHDLNKIKEKFKNYLDSTSFKTNAPLKEAEDDLDKLSNKGLESYVEQLLVDDNNQKEILKLSSASAIVGRQLPVGLYEDNKDNKDNKEVCIGGTAAADFWAVDGDTIKVYELKSNNPMVGIITEIFFYTNYVYDVFIAGYLDHNKGVVSHQTNVKLRNYDQIKGEQVQGIMISNRKDEKKDNIKGWHTSLKDASSRNQIIDQMNDNSIKKKIQYGWIEYNFKMSITVTP